MISVLTILIQRFCVLQLYLEKSDHFIFLHSVIICICIMKENITDVISKNVTFISSSGVHAFLLIKGKNHVLKNFNARRGSQSPAH